MIGIDMTDIDQVDTSEQFLKELASDEEIKYIQKSFCESLRHQRIGALQCVKGAVNKALGIGRGENLDIELSHDSSGKPFVILHGKALKKFEKDFQGKKLEVSISHTPKMAVAVAVIE